MLCILNIGDKVFLHTEFIHMTHPSQKLADKYLGPFEIIGVAGPASFVRFLHQAHIGACLFIFVFLSLLLAHNPNICYYNVSRRVQPLLSTNKSYIFMFCPLSH